MENVQRWCGTCSYDGTDFCGWQSQSNGNAIQDFLERRLAQIFRRRVPAVGSGRTDAGVHALAQIFHFDATGWNHGQKELLRALQCGLPRTIRVWDVRTVDADFHARFSSTGKRYTYFFQRGFTDPFHCRFRWHTGNAPLDDVAMDAAARLFLGSHDFRAFANLRRDGTDGNSVKTLTRSEIVRRDDCYVYATEGNGYLYRMVRRIVGTIVEVGRGKILIGDVVERLATPDVKYVHTPSAAPAAGLFLEKVFFGQKNL
ncbi:MAG: tRNA pseudouridine(38-40) synthase TruA [Puniceicoccales bacterium]|jgi:tRNA pseudouridine38-40 synthase|nr:tRNA pseudouridine(38-40) synthase TruA [Puniceicoccales bacterium]